jgi:hypothetical protein
MRLRILESSHRPIQWVQLMAVRMLTGTVPGPIAVLSYRREFVGRVLSECFEEALRHSTEWTKGELELFAAFVSKLNQCKY